MNSFSHFLFDGTGAVHAKEAAELYVSLAPTEANRRQRSRYAHDVMLNLGRPSEIAFLEVLLAQVGNSSSLKQHLALMDSLMLHQDAGAASTTRTAQQTISAARAWEKAEGGR